MALVNLMRLEKMVPHSLCNSSNAVIGVAFTRHCGTCSWETLHINLKIKILFVQFGTLSSPGKFEKSFSPHTKLKALGFSGDKDEIVLFLL